jgi:hypothetical protein
MRNGSGNDASVASTSDSALMHNFSQSNFTPRFWCALHVNATFVMRRVFRSRLNGMRLSFV